MREFSLQIIVSVRGRLLVMVYDNTLIKTNVTLSPL
jgi:hypothetical protein